MQNQQNLKLIIKLMYERQKTKKVYLKLYLKP